MILNINKPSGMTSHDVVNEVRKITGERRVGHAGTLDPFAEGVLIVGVGRASTKQLGSITKDTQKEYRATLQLGITSSTGDPEGIKTPHPQQDMVQNITTEDIQNVLDTFIGIITQTPPAYSAIKIKGEPAYKRARRGEHVLMSSREVTIYTINLVSWNPPTLTLEVVCSSGTYIRTLAEDIGNALGIGAYLTSLIRTRVGNYTLSKSISLDQLPKILTQ